MTQRQHRNVSQLKKSEVKAIRRRYAKGELNQRELGEEFGLAAYQVGRIVRGEARAEDGGPIVVRERSKLTRRQIAMLRRRYDSGSASQATLAQEYGLSAPAISRLLRGLTHSDVGGPRAAKGSMPRGQKLTPKQILEVARSDENMSALARKHGVSRQAIQALRRRWTKRLAAHDA